MIQYLKTFWMSQRHLQIIWVWVINGPWGAEFQRGCNQVKDSKALSQWIFKLILKWLHNRYISPPNCKTRGDLPCREFSNRLVVHLKRHFYLMIYLEIWVLTSHIHISRAMYSKNSYRFFLPYSSNTIQFLLYM